MSSQSDAERRIRSLVRAVEADEAHFCVLSTGEKIAVGFVLDRPDLLNWWGTILDCVDRLGQDWTRAALRIQRDGWRP